MAIKLNIDQQIQNGAEVILGGKTYNIYFNDKFQRATIDAMAEMGGYFKKIDELTKKDENGNAKIDEFSVDQDKEESNKIMNQVNQTAINFFDDYIEQGAGQEIFEHYHEDTNALWQAISMLQEASERDNREQRRSKEKQYTKNNKQNAKKR